MRIPRHLLQGSILAVLTAGFVALASCTATEMTGASGKKAAPKDTKKPGDDSDDDDDDDDDDEGGPGVDPKVDTGKVNPNLETLDDTGDIPIRVFDDDFEGTFLVKQLEPESVKTIWAVTRPGNAYWFRLQGDQVAETRTWTGLTSSDNGGSRTYVTEKGVVIARTGGHVYWIDPEKTPQGPIEKANGLNYFKLNGASAGDRLCVVSYRKDKKRYVGIGYGDGDFVEFAMDDKPPYAPRWTERTGSTKVPGVKWGYSCFIDQVRLIYYGQWVNGSNGVGAVDLKAMQPIQATSKAPNASFTSANVPNATVGARANGSYAMNGDIRGNVYNGKNFYTLAHERGSKTVWGESGGMLHIFPEKCLQSMGTCAGHAAFNMASLNTNVRPMSGLGDGRMVGMFRHGTNGQVYLLKLKNKKDLSQGVDVTRIAELQGDPYMYTDFTGATLYLTNSETTFELDAGDGFDPAKKNLAAGFAWMPNVSTDKDWREIKFEIRCYTDGDEKPGYDQVDDIKAAFEQTVIRTDSCTDKKYNRIDVRLTQQNDGDSLMNVGRVQVTAYQ